MAHACPVFRQSPIAEREDVDTILSALFDIKRLLVQLRDLLKDDDEEEEAEIEPDS